MSWAVCKLGDCLFHGCISLPPIPSCSLYPVERDICGFEQGRLFFSVVRVSRYPNAERRVQDRSIDQERIFHAGCQC